MVNFVFVNLPSHPMFPAKKLLTIVLHNLELGPIIDLMPCSRIYALSFLFQSVRGNYRVGHLFTFLLRSGTVASVVHLFFFQFLNGLWPLLPCLGMKIIADIFNTKKNTKTIWSVNLVQNDKAIILNWVNIGYILTLVWHITYCPSSLTQGRELKWLRNSPPA